MTVFDELNSYQEYLDMEFVEFLEFLVRITYLVLKLEKAADNNDIEGELGSESPSPIEISNKALEDKVEENLRELL